MPAPLDLQVTPRYVLDGTVVTMNAKREVFKGRIYIDGATIAAVHRAGAKAPGGFQGAPVLATKGAIYPGLIELHNHLPYDILPLWDVPKKYGSREQWRGILEYRKLVSGPMQLLAERKGYSPAIARYVESKCLLGGVTSSQGITLNADAGIRRWFPGIVRNVESAPQPDLPAVAPSVQDVAPKDARQFLDELRGKYAERCRLIHLSEGIDDRARGHFLALRLPSQEWAITDSLAGIHAAALREEDWKIYGKHGGAMVWSPLSNLLLYGETANVEAAKRAGARIALGSDWSPTGSKNLLGELKVAYLESKRKGKLFTNHELVAMATIEAAKVIRWQARLGSIEAGKLADLIVVQGTRKDPYLQLIAADERDLTLVVIDGVPRYGQRALMQRFAGPTEAFTLDGDARLLNLRDAAAAELMGGLSLKRAREQLKKGLAALPDPPPILPPPAGGGGPPAPDWSLVLEEEEDFGMAQRPLAPLSAGALVELMRAAAVPAKELVKPIKLDPLTVAEDPEHFLKAIDRQRNLPAPIKKGLRAFYGA